MKTKLTLFVTVLAAALFMGGCAVTIEFPGGGKKAADKPPVPTAVKWGGHWYAVFSEPCDWGAAKKKCEQLGGHLAYVESAAENSFLCKLAKDTPGISEWAWIGGTDEKKEGEWLWLNGKPIKSTFWHRGEPSGHQDENYLVLWYGLNTWNDCPAKYYPSSTVCEWE